MAVVDASHKLLSVLRGKRLIVAWLLSTVVVGVAAGSFFELPKFYRLSRYGLATTGVVADLQPLNHRSVNYRYTANARTHRGGGHAGDIDRNFEEVRLDEGVLIFYDPENPGVSCMGQPSRHLRKMLLLTAIVTSTPSFFFLALAFKRNWKS
ncbi:MAG TPA: DUF3592 domain-containing protein [Pyrinomonadaceae bacterium]